MMTTDHNSNQNGSSKNGKLNPRCDKCKKIPSIYNCLRCILNLHCLLNIDSNEDENLSVKEQIMKVNYDIDDLRPVPSLFVQIFEACSDKKIKLERKLIELLTKAELIKGDTSNMEVNGPLKTKERIPIIGKKSDVGQKIGFFFFNPDNKDGLHLPKTHVSAVIKSFCESYKPNNGTKYSSRYLFDNVIAGANKKPTEKFKINSGSQKPL